MRRHALLLLILLSLPLCAQDTWIRTYEPFPPGTGWHVYTPEDIILCDDGGYATNGRFLAESNEYNWLFGYLIKFDAAGDIEWAKRDSIPGLTGATESTCFTQTNDGGFFSVARNALSSGYSYVKRDADGELEWAQMSFPYFPQTMVSLADGSVVCAGYYYDTVVEAFGITKLTPDLQFEWGNHFLYRGMLGALEAMCVSNYPEPEAGFLAVGDSIDPDEIILAKFDALGDTTWVREIDTPLSSYINTGYDVCEDPDGNVYVSYRYLEDFEEWFAIAQYSPDGELLDTLVLSDNPGEIRMISCLEYNPDQDLLLGVGLCNTSNDLTMVGLQNMETIVWSETYFAQFRASGDRSFEFLPEGGYICAGISGPRMTLLKMDEYGGVPVQDTESPIVQAFLSNFPNPFNPTTTIQFELEQPSQVKLEIYNVRGQKIASLLNESCSTGTHTISWNAKDLPSGIYFAKLVTESFTRTHKLLLLK